MTKVELIKNLAEAQNLSHKDAKSLVEIILETMTDALIRGNNIEIRGFGSFQVREYDEYTGRNPKTGETIKVPSKKVPVFKMGKDLREKMRTFRR
jgi:integration host factor subunit beta